MTARPLETIRAQAWSHLFPDEYVMLGAILSVAAIVVVIAPAHLPFSDGFQLYFFKAHAFFADRSIVPYYTHSTELSYSIPAHPPLIPLSVTRLYLFMGDVNEHAALLLWPSLYISLVTAFFFVARSGLPRRVALWCTLAFMLITSTAIAGGFTDMPLAANLFMSSGLIWLWAVSPPSSTRLLIVAGLLLGATTLTKEEGFPAALVVLAASPLLIRWTTLSAFKSTWWRALAAAAPPCLLAFAWWQILHMSYAVPELLVQPTNRTLGTMLSRIVVSAAGYLARSISCWFAELTVIAACLIYVTWSKRRGYLTRARVLPVLAFLGAIVSLKSLGDIVGIAASSVDIHAEVSTTATRLLIQLTPIVFLAAALLLPTIGVGDMSEAKAQTPAAAAIAMERA